MRVIAGTARGTNLQALPGEDVTRPTINRVKEAMFSSVQFLVPGARVLDGPRAGRRAGVPHGSTPPRALLKAVLEDEGAIVRDLDRAVEAYIERLMPLG